MSKDLDKDLVKDIYGVLEDPNGVSPEAMSAFGTRLTEMLIKRLGPRSDPPRLRMSNLGTNCDRKLWYMINTPELAEPLTGKERLKFLYGDILEELIISLAELAGYKVTGRQDSLNLHGIEGHRDAVIEGRIFDVKTTSPFSFKKFAGGGLHLGELTDDPFGYRDQLQSYLEASQDDSLVTDKDNASFLVIDKVSGGLYVDTHERNRRDFASLIKAKQAMLNGGLPDRGFRDLPEGKSGNRKLGVECSYCSFKEKCWPNLRTFLYSNKPVFMTHIVKEPRVPEDKSDTDEPF